MRWLDDGIFVSGAASPYARAVGAQVIAVGGMPIDQVVQQLATVIPHGNDQWVHYEAPQFLTIQQILQGLHIVPVAATSDFTFRTLAGDQFVLSIAPGNGTLITAPDAAAGQIPAYLRNTAVNYWCTYFPQNRVLYFRYNRCANDPSNPFPTFAATLLQTFDANPVDVFVFDFRGNTGGDDSIINPLTNGLLQRLPTVLANPRFRV